MSILTAPRRIAIDFDGTIADTDFPTIKGIKPGAREALALFRTLGFQVVVWSCRTCHWDYEVYGGTRDQPTLERDRVKDMIACLDAHGIEYDEVDDGSKGKPGADLYIDDKGLRFMDDWEWIADWVSYHLVPPIPQPVAECITEVMDECTNTKSRVLKPAPFWGL